MPSTTTLLRVGDLEIIRYPELNVRLRGPDGPVQERELGLNECTVGTNSQCTMVSEDPGVSRRHLSLLFDERGVRLRDLDSKNGTFIGGLRVTEVILPLDTYVTLGDSQLWVAAGTLAREQPLSLEPRFGNAVGLSIPMRALFAMLSQAAAADVPILLLGESGTGKEVLARAIHEHSPRREGPFIVFDCSAVPPSLIEAELFGHERGAFTGATDKRQGLFEQAHQGTLLLDELGELPLELQTRLLRVLETKEVRRLGGGDPRPADARIVGATHRDLQARVQAGTFRQDLFYRLAVVLAQVPPLRERKEDIPLLAQTFLARQTPARSLDELPPQTLELLQLQHWPGNVRELQNTLQRLLLFGAYRTRGFEVRASRGPEASNP